MQATTIVSGIVIGAITFSGSKVALLRELGVIENKRGKYGVIGGF